MPCIAIYTTTASREEAQTIARHLVSNGLVACAQIDAIESFYTWEGATQHDQEYRLMLKTTEERYHAVETAIRTLHSYTLPAIYAVTFTHISQPYAGWIQECTA